MPTTIVGPGQGGGSVNWADQISQDFAPIYSKWGSPSAGGGTGPGGVTPQPVSGANDSLSAFFRGLSNLQGVTAPSFLQAGTNLLGSGMGVTQTGVDMSGQGFQTTEQGLATLQPAIDFYNKLASGDPTAMTQALSPAAQTYADIFSGATTAASQGGIRGGQQATTVANMPAAQGAAVGRAAMQMQPLALQALGQLGGEQAQIGAAQGQIGQGIAGTGVNIGQLGLDLTGQGGAMLKATIDEMLQKMGINITGGTAASIGKIF